MLTIVVTSLSTRARLGESTLIPSKSIFLIVDSGGGGGGGGGGGKCKLMGECTNQSTYNFNHKTGRAQKNGYTAFVDKITMLGWGGIVSV